MKARRNEFRGAPGDTGRRDTVLHRIALFPAPGPCIQHISFEVASLDDRVRARNFLGQRQAANRFGHGPARDVGTMCLHDEPPLRVARRHARRKYVRRAPVRRELAAAPVHGEVVRRLDSKPGNPAFRAPPTGGAQPR